MAYYPVFLEVAQRPCLVIGGGAIAYQKAKALVGCGASVTLVSPEIGPAIRMLVRQGRVRWRRRRFRAGDLAGMELAIAATDDPSVNLAASRAARRRGIWINVVDQPRLCSFIVPSVVRRGKLAIAISTSGASPALSKWIRKDLEKRYGRELGRLLERSAKIRPAVQKAVPNYNQRKKLYEQAIAAYFNVMAKVLRQAQDER